MSSTHPTITDKYRLVNLTADADWHAFMIKDVDGKIKRSIVVPPGTYLLSYQISGSVTTKPAGPMDVRIDRYPYDPEDNGTAWETVQWRDGTKWWATRVGKVEVRASGNYSTSIGISYQLAKGAKASCSSRILKFMRLPD